MISRSSHRWGATNFIPGIDGNALREEFPDKRHITTSGNENETIRSYTQRVRFIGNATLVVQRRFPTVHDSPKGFDAIIHAFIYKPSLFLVKSKDIILAITRYQLPAAEWATFLCAEQGVNDAAIDPTIGTSLFKVRQARKLLSRREKEFDPREHARSEDSSYRLRTDPCHRIASASGSLCQMPRRERNFTMPRE